jgi:hypothetical protein
LKTDFEKTFTIMPAAMSAKPMSAERSSACFDQTQATAVMSTIPNPDQMAYTILVGITRDTVIQIAQDLGHRVVEAESVFSEGSGFWVNGKQVAHFMDDSLMELALLFRRDHTSVMYGIAMTIEDSWGGDIVTAAIAHLAHSTPPEFLFTSTDFNSYVTTSFADGAPQRTNGRLAASTAPGLGISPRLDVLGKPSVIVE